MNLDHYQRDAARTMNPGLTPSERLLDAAAGLAEESGEVLGAVRKHLFQARPIDKGALMKELGDALWCLAAVATSQGISLGDVAALNLEKLRVRYPQGFTVADRAARRDEPDV